MGHIILLVYHNGEDKIGPRRNIVNIKHLALHVQAGYFYKHILLVDKKSIAYNPLVANLLFEWSAYMSEAPKNLLEFLEQLRAERRDLDILISGLEKRLGIAPAVVEGEEPSSPKVTVSVDSIPVGFFHNLTQPAAVEKLLRLNPGHPLETGEILEAFRKAGVVLTSKNAPTILYTTLKRNPKFERVAGKAWGLAEWYPEKRKKKENDKEKAAESGDNEDLS